ncbi:MAG TPA: Chromate resistance protein ChrB [Nocardioidaceae bacterium]|nr:Chromate resistance protein ChrB [Nocardioidaceae bacterium]
MAGWVVLMVRVPSEPARHRVAVWRELRKAGATPLGPGAWALPDLPAVEAVLDRVAELVQRASGDLLRLRSTGLDEVDNDLLLARYHSARDDEWREFLADCDKYLAELVKEHTHEKYTLAELEEEEQSLDRLRRWYREIRGRDLIGKSNPVADKVLKECVARFDEYAEAVYRKLGDPGPAPGS